MKVPVVFSLYSAKMKFIKNSIFLKKYFHTDSGPEQSTYLESRTQDSQCTQLG